MLVLAIKTQWRSNWFSIEFIVKLYNFFVIHLLPPKWNYTFQPNCAKLGCSGIPLLFSLLFFGQRMRLPDSRKSVSWKRKESEHLKIYGALQCTVDSRSHKLPSKRSLCTFLCLAGATHAIGKFSGLPDQCSAGKCKQLQGSSPTSWGLLIAFLWTLVFVASKTFFIYRLNYIH